MRRYIAFIHDLNNVLRNFSNELATKGRKTPDPDDQFDQLHLYIWYSLNRIFNPDFGSQEKQLDLLSLMVSDTRDVQLLDQTFKKSVYAELAKVTPSLILRPNEFMHHYVTDGKQFAQLMLFVPTYVFKEIPENMTPLTQVGVSAMIDRYLDHFESTSTGKLMTQGIESILTVDIPKDKLVPRKLWQQ